MNPHLKTALYVVGGIAVAWFVWRQILRPKMGPAKRTGTGASLVTPPVGSPTITPGTPVNTGAVIATGTQAPAAFGSVA